MTEIVFIQIVLQIVIIPKVPPNKSTLLMTRYDSQVGKCYQDFSKLCSPVSIRNKFNDGKQDRKLIKHEPKSSGQNKTFKRKKNKIYGINKLPTAEVNQNSTSNYSKLRSAKNKQ